jgi:hypothetical protein
VAEPSRHLQWAKNNEELAESFNLDDNFEVDRAIIVLFYAAVHYVDAYLSSRTKRQPDHAVASRRSGAMFFFQARGESIAS